MNPEDLSDGDRRSGFARPRGLRSRHPSTAGPRRAAAAFGVQSQLCMAIHPKTGKAYMFGLHQCSHPRIWTEDEKTAVRGDRPPSRRRLTSLLAYLDLRDREGQLRTLVQTIPDLVWVKDVDGALPALQSAVRARARRRPKGRSSARRTMISSTSELAELVPRQRPPGDRDWRNPVGGMADARRRRRRAACSRCSRRRCATRPARRSAWSGSPATSTERRKSEEQLRVAATAFEAQEGMVILDADKRILRVNHAFIEMTGHVAEDVVGKTPQQIARDPRAGTFPASPIASSATASGAAKLEPAQRSSARSSPPGRRSLRCAARAAKRRTTS